MVVRCVSFFIHERLPENMQLMGKRLASHDLSIEMEVEESCCFVKSRSAHFYGGMRANRITTSHRIPPLRIKRPH